TGPREPPGAFRREHGRAGESCDAGGPCRRRSRPPPAQPGVTPMRESGAVTSRSLALVEDRLELLSSAVESLLGRDLVVQRLLDVARERVPDLGPARDVRVRAEVLGVLHRGGDRGVLLDVVALDSGLADRHVTNVLRILVVELLVAHEG